MTLVLFNFIMEFNTDDNRKPGFNKQFNKERRKQIKGKSHQVVAVMEAMAL